MRHNYALIIPALNEAESIASVPGRVPRELFCQVIVVDNGSRDQTADVAAAAGAEVVCEPRRGYGRACWGVICRIEPSAIAIVFMDADLSDYPEDLEVMIQAFDEDRWDLILGSRVCGNPEPGSLAAFQRFGNWFSTHLISMMWHVRFTDLGPMRIIRRASLSQLDLQNRTYGWTVEMQARAAKLGLRVRELPVRYSRRLCGQSKVSGSIYGSLRAGIRSPWTILRCFLFPLSTKSAATSSRPERNAGNELA